MSEIADHHVLALERRDRRPINVAAGETLCFVCVRNEELRLPYFLDYHRKLGVDRFFFIDNASDDGTMGYLMGQPDTHVYFTSSSYASSNYGVDWLNSLIAHYAIGHWALTLDADELLIYPKCEVLNLKQLERFLDAVQADGLVTFLLDMYGDQTIRKTRYLRGMPFLETCPYFDWNTYHERDSDGIPVRGGPRHRLFWAGRVRPIPSPVLKKIPLIKWRAGLRYEASTHAVQNLQFSRLTGALLHFKFFCDFYALVEREVARKEHWAAAAQYDSYLETLKQSPDLNPHFDGSKRYSSSNQLVELGLMRMPPEFEPMTVQEPARATHNMASLLTGGH
jgi:hypothetical protein